MNASHLCHGRRARGFTLAEFMVAMTITLIILAALSSVYVSSGQAFRANDNFSRIQENSRIAFDLMSRDLRQSGYTGCIGTTSSLTNKLNSNTALFWDYSKPVYGYESTATAWNTTPDSVIASPAPLTGLNHDILVVRSIDDGGGPIIDNTSSTGTFTISGQSGISAGDVLMVSNCAVSVVFQASGITTSGSTDIVSHAATTGSTPGNQSNDLGTTFKNSELRRVSTKIYYIGTGANNIPALFVRRSNETAAQELVEGIDGMQIKYGIDSDANYAANGYYTASNVTDWTQVVSVQITLTAISPENYLATAAQSNAAGTATDRRQRQQMTMTISLRNKTG